MTGQQISAAWRAFRETPQGKGLLEGEARGEYLGNRLELAFLAGVEAAERAHNIPRSE